jgi:RNA polymerase sigma-70 factor (ECF subfamily)
LVQRVAQGDEDAVEALYHTYADAVLQFVYPRVGERREDAEEILPEVFLSAVALAGTYDGSCAVSTWLCGIAKRCLARFRRNQGRQKRIPPDRIVSLDEETLQVWQECEAEVSPAEEAIRRMEAARVVEAMMAALREDEREVLRLRYVEEFSLREIAVVMGRTEKAIERLLSRSRKKAEQAGAQEMGR